jgi:carbonic anhydrase
VDVVLGEIDLPDPVGAVVRRAAPRLVRDGLRPPRLPPSRRRRDAVATIGVSMLNADRMLEVAATRTGELAAPGLSPRPRRKVAVLSCMDTRIDLFPMLGLERGDAHIIRNAGGLVTDDAIRSLSASQRLLGTEEIVVVMHDGCGLHGASEDDFAQALAADGVLPNWRLGAFEDVEATLRHSLSRLSSSPELRAREHIRGFVFNPETGELREVGAPPAPPLPD